MEQLFCMVSLRKNNTHILSISHMGIDPWDKRLVEPHAICLLFESHLNVSLWFCNGGQVQCDFLKVPCNLPTLKRLDSKYWLSLTYPNGYKLYSIWRPNLQECYQPHFPWYGHWHVVVWLGHMDTCGWIIVGSHFQW